MQLYKCVVETDETFKSKKSRNSLLVAVKREPTVNSVKACGGIAGALLRSLEYVLINDITFLLSL